MAGAVLSPRISQARQGPLRRRLSDARARLADRVDRVRFPEAPSGDEHWQRAVMNAAVDARIAELDPTRCRAAEISGDGHAEKPWREFTNLAYPDFDLCAPVEEPGRYDVVICEQVLEHVIDPWVAARNLHDLCVPGGDVIVTSPFLIKVHELPYFGMRDYWRFTPRGLETLLEHAGLEVCALGAWGNRQAVLGNLGRWSAQRWWHSLRNERDVPVQVWAFARRPEE